MMRVVPFRGCLQDDERIDTSSSQKAEEDHYEYRHEPTRPAQLAPAHDRQPKPIPHHAPPPLFASNTAPPPTAPGAAATSPAAPPKMACVICGMNNILMMNATKTIKQGIKFAIHISIEYLR